MKKKRHYSMDMNERHKISKKMRGHMDVHGGNGKNMNQGEYAGVDARRRLEYEDSEMIHEDHRAVANLPQEVMMKPWPSSYSDGLEGLDDTIRGVDDQIGTDNREMHKFRSRSKY